MRPVITALFAVVGVLVLWSALAKATLNPVSWILYWIGTRRRLAVLGLVILLLLAAAGLQRTASGLSSGPSPTPVVVHTSCPGEPSARRGPSVLNWAAPLIPDSRFRRFYAAICRFRYSSWTSIGIL